ncbi:signal peptidase II [Sphingomonas sp. HT-1]|uniref:signal peptidase II n=1 Tax=unclassified Sphingomonas TaxID=196159 RepID=UPI00037C19C0|nr:MULTISPECIES: signal peptidase II [unclassified Sphingomonas]KTF68590.1 signal peptidase II [Sphingomonas sp. WG]
MTKSVRILGFGAALIVFLLDQLTKYIVTGPLGLVVQNDSLTILPIFDLRFVKNVGVSLGLLSANSPASRWLLVLMTAAIAVGVLVWMLRERKKGDVLALGLVLGGACGNILDRARLGYVVDFADLHFGEWRPFLVFNVADAAITIGVVILLIRALLVRDKTPKSPAPVEKKFNA